MVDLLVDGEEPLGLRTPELPGAQVRGLIDRVVAVAGRLDLEELERLPVRFGQALLDELPHGVDVAVFHRVDGHHPLGHQIGPGDDVAGHGVPMERSIVLGRPRVRYHVAAGLVELGSFSRRVANAVPTLPALVVDRLGQRVKVPFPLGSGRVVGDVLHSAWLLRVVSVRPAERLDALAGRTCETPLLPRAGLE